MLFKDITSVSRRVQIEVLEWRNHIDIRKNMYTDTLISIENHKKWLSTLKNSHNTKVYLAYKSDDIPIGIVSINKLNYLHQSAEWAFYLNPIFLKSKGLGVLLEYHFLNFIFDNFDIIKLNCEVISSNISVVKLHKRFFFSEEGIRRKNIIKNSKREDVVLLGILKHEWHENRDKLTKIIQRL